MSIIINTKEQIDALPVSTAVQSALDGKQATLVSTTNIKSINGASVLGAGDLTVGGAVAWGGVTGTLSNQTDLQNALNAKQAAGTYATGTGSASGTNTGDNTVATALTGTPSITVATVTTTGNIELGHATDTTISRVSAGVIAIEGVTLVGNATHTGDVTGSGALTVNESYAGGKCLTSNFTTSSVSAVSTNLAFAIAASAVYDVDIYGTCSKATSATGLKFAINCPAGCTIKGVQYGGGATLAASLVPSLITAINTLGTALATGIGIQVGFHLHFRVVNSTNAGNITLQVATVTSNVATVYAGTKMNWCKTVQV